MVGTASGRTAHVAPPDVLAPTPATHHQRRFAPKRSPTPLDPSAVDSHCRYHLRDRKGGGGARVRPAGAWETARAGGARGAGATRRRPARCPPVAAAGARSGGGLAALTGQREDAIRVLLGGLAVDGGGLGGGGPARGFERTLVEVWDLQVPAARAGLRPAGVGRPDGRPPARGCGAGQRRSAQGSRATRARWRGRRAGSGGSGCRRSGGLPAPLLGTAIGPASAKGCLPAAEQACTHRAATSRLLGWAWARVRCARRLPASDKGLWVLSVNVGAVAGSAEQEAARKHPPLLEGVLAARAVPRRVWLLLRACMVAATSASPPCKRHFRHWP